MAQTEYSTTANLPLETIWDFVQEMDNWAQLVTGYQEHVKESATDSLWTLKGDVGVLARKVQFKVHIVEWNGPERVRFELKGLNEPLEGEGIFTMTADSGDAEASEPSSQNWFTRMIEALVRLFVKRKQGAVERDVPVSGGSRLTFNLRIDPGGPMAPMINAMMQPAMNVAAEDLSNRILSELEQRQNQVS